MSTVKSNAVQVGQSLTATNNFTLYQPTTPDGTVRIGLGNSGSTTTDLFTLTNAGEFRAVSLTETSSIAYKENINQLTGCLDKICELRGVSYDWKESFSQDKSQQVGLIAEEVDKVIPQLVSKNQYGIVEGVHYTKLVAYLVESIKELKAEVDKLKGE